MKNWEKFVHGFSVLIQPARDVRITLFGRFYDVKIVKIVVVTS